MSATLRQSEPRSGDKRPVILVEDDVFLRLFQVILDPEAPVAMIAAFADFMAHDEPDFAGWCDGVRARSAGLFPARVVLFASDDEFRAAMPSADALVVEGQQVGAVELSAAPRLRMIQKYGVMLRNLDMRACAVRGVEVLTIRRRANIQCAEHIFALMLSLARKIHSYQGKLSAEQLASLGHTLRPFDRTYTPNGNWARVPGLRALNESTIGIIGMGEIGREVATRANAFGMRVIYHQRTRHQPGLEQVLGVSYAPLEQLLAQSDWVIPQIPGSPATRHFLGRERLRLLKPGACIVNVSRADIIDREALIDELRSGHIGGLGLDPPYQSPGRDDDELLEFPNVVITPHFGGSPRQNALKDFEDMVVGMARAYRSETTT